MGDGNQRVVLSLEMMRDLKFSTKKIDVFAGKIFFSRSTSGARKHGCLKLDDR